MIPQNQFITSLHFPNGACLLLTKGQTSGGGLSISSRYLQHMQYLFLVDLVQSLLFSSKGYFCK